MNNKSIHVIKAMENIPMKVETRMLAFNDSIATANDRVTGETTIIAFRSTALKNGQGGSISYNNTPGISF